jgi:hypothetical protein
MVFRLLKLLETLSHSLHLVKVVSSRISGTVFHANGLTNKEKHILLTLKPMEFLIGS